MGMSIIGAVATVDKATMMANVEEAFNLKLSFSEQDVWSEHDGGVNGDSIVIYSANGASLVYFSSDFFSANLEHNFRDLISKVDKGVAFFGNETSMAFGLMFGENKRVTAEDFYLFEEGFTQEGPNILNLNEHSDIIWDGFFPTIKQYVGEMSDDTQVEVYNFTKVAASQATTPSSSTIPIVKDPLDQQEKSPLHSGGSLLSNPLEENNYAVENEVPPLLPNAAESAATSSTPLEIPTTQSSASMPPPPMIPNEYTANGSYGNEQNVSNPSLAMDPGYYVIPVSAGLRFVNSLIDGIALQLISAMAGGIIGLVLGSLALDLTDGPILFIIGNLMVTIALSITYHFIMENANGTTIGKLLTQTRVVHETGRKATSKEIFIRSLCRYIPFDAFSYLGSGVGWHDTISKTRVVSKENYDQIIMLSENR